MNAWDLLKYLYLISAVTMMMYIIKHGDSFLVSYGMQKKENQEDHFVYSMMMNVIFSPIVWMLIFIEKNRRK